MTRHHLYVAAAGLFAALASPAAAQSAFDLPAIEDDALQSIAGRADVSQVSESENTATVADNSIGDNSTTGEIRIADSAFQNLSGLSLLNVNTGNNVAINAAMNVNISINPGL